MITATSMAAIAALIGSLVGGVLSFATTYFSHKHQGIRERISKDLDQRSALYTDFNQVASELLLDSLDHKLDRPDLIIRMMTLMGRVRMISSDAVVESGQHAISQILASYRSPMIDYKAQILNDEMDFAIPLMAFTDACRAERAEMLGRLV